MTTERRLSRRLLFRTVAAIAIVAVILLLVTGWIMDDRLYSQRREGMFREMNMVRGMIETIMLDDIEGKHFRVHSMLNQLLEDSTYLNIWMISTDTTVLFSRNFSDHVMKLDLMSAPGCAGCHADPDEMVTNNREYYYQGNTRAYHLTIPIRNKKECKRCHDPSQDTRAIMVADFSLSQLDNEIWISRLQLHSFLSISFVLMVLFAFYLLKTRAYKPLELIATRLSRIAEGEFTVTADDSQDNIVSFISSLLNETARRLRSSYADLENKIQVRTHSLRNSEKMLAEERDKLALILENSPQGILGFEPDGRVLFANKNAGEALGVTPADLLNANVSDFTWLKKAFDASFSPRALSGSEISIGRGNEYWKSPAGREFQLQTALAGVPEGSNLLLMVMSDVTERRKIERNLERHERLASVGQLAAGVAHEVGNPLSAIHSLVQIARKTRDLEQAGNHLDLITHHIERISKIVRNLSGFARTPDEKEVLCPISDVVRAAMEIAGFDPRAKNVVFDLKAPEQNIRLLMRRDQLMQSLLNIILNGFDAVKEKPEPEISVDISSEGKWCTVSIADNGCGMDEASVEKVFEPFYTTKPVGRGTGLGLSVTYRIITDMGGHISVTSTVGEGTCFTISLPMERGNESQARINSNS